MAKVKRELVVPVVETGERSRSGVVFRTAYGAKRRVQQIFVGAGRTKQSFKAECDVNNIMARFMKTGIVDFVTKHEGRYADVTGLEFRQAQELVAGARSMFEDLPSKVRARFDNEPGEFLAFMSDPANAQEAVKMGLAKAVKEEATPLPVLPAKPVVEAPQGPGAAPEGTAGASK